jgi:hypothetical protein
MNTIPATLAAFALTISSYEQASRLFDLARVITGHRSPNEDSLRTFQMFASSNDFLPEALPESGIHRKSFAKRVAKALAIRILDLPENTPVHAGLFETNARALLAIADNLPLDALADAIQPNPNAKPMFIEDENGLHGNYVFNSILLPDMTLTYTSVRHIDGMMRYVLGRWTLDDQYTREEVSTYQEALAVLRGWVMAPASSKQSPRRTTLSSQVNTEAM